MGTSQGRTLLRPGQIQPSNLIAWWKLDAAGTVTTDEQSNYTLSETGSVADGGNDYWSVSGEGSGDFDGTNDYLTATRDATLDLTGKFSVAAWIRPDSVTTVTLFDKDLSNDGFGAQFDGSGALDFRMTNDSLTHAGMSANRWYHVAFVYDQTNKMIYVDGNLVAIEAETTDNADAATNLTIGALGGGGNKWNGLMKDFAAWSNNLTATEVKSLARGQDRGRVATARPDKFPTNLKAWWKLNEVITSGQRDDSTSNNHDLTDVGTVPTLGGYIEGAAADFDGSADYFTAVDHADFDFSGGTFSIAAWVKFDSVTGARAIYGHATDANNSFSFQIESSKLNVAVISAASQTVDVIGSTTLQVNVWYHVACTESADTWKVYLDGKDDTDTGGTDSNRAANYTGTIRVGGDGNAGSLLNGKLNDVAVWKGTALSAAEIASLAAVLDVNTQGLVAYYKMNDAANAAAVDSVNAKNMTDSTGGIASISAQVGNGRDLESSSSEFFTLADDADFDASYFSVFAWFNPDDVSNEARIINKLTGGAHADNNGWTLRQDTSAAKMSMNVGNGSANAAATGAIAPTNGNWFHGGGKYDGAQVHVYGQGVNEASSALVGTFPGNANAIQIGKLGTAASFSDMSIDEVVFFKRAVHDEEAKALYIKGFNAKEALNSEFTLNSLVPIF